MAERDNHDLGLLRPEQRFSGTNAPSTELSGDSARVGRALIVAESPVSYDLMLVEKRPDEDWEAALDRLGSGAGTDRELSTQRRALWERVAARLVELDGEFERFDGPGFIELSHDELGYSRSRCSRTKVPSRFPIGTRAMRRAR